MSDHFEEGEVSFGVVGPARVVENVDAQAYSEKAWGVLKTPEDDYLFYPKVDVENLGSGPCLGVLAQDSTTGKVIASGHFANPSFESDFSDLALSRNRYMEMNQSIQQAAPLPETHVYLFGQADIPPKERRQIKQDYLNIGVPDANIHDLRNDGYVSQNAVFDSQKNELLIWET